MAEKKFIGNRSRSKEGPRHVTGRGLFTDDFILPGMLQAMILRSPHAHAKISSVDPAKPNLVLVTGRNLEGCSLDLGANATVHAQRSDDEFVAALVSYSDGAPPSQFAVQADGREVTTVEGLAKDGELTPIQEAFVKNYAFQCGYCTPGMVMTSHALLQRNPNPSEGEIRKALAGNLCMCTGYVQIVEAVKEAAEKQKTARQ